MTATEMHDLLLDIYAQTELAFDSAAAEPKLSSRSEQTARCKAPLVPVPSQQEWTQAATDSDPTPAEEMQGAVLDGKGRLVKEVMRKHMTRGLDEAMQTHPDLVYLGEDVEHGGTVLL